MEKRHLGDADSRRESSRRHGAKNQMPLLLSAKKTGFEIEDPEKGKRNTGKIVNQKRSACLGISGRRRKNQDRGKGA